MHPTRGLAACLLIVMFVTASARAEREVNSIASSATLASAETAAWLVDQRPLIAPEELAALMTAAEAPVAISFSNLPMLTSGAAEGAGEDQWVISANFAIWAPGINGDIGVGRFTTHANASFIDILDNTDSLIGVTGLVRVTRGKIGGYFGGTYDKMGLEAGPNQRTHVVSTIGIMSFGLSYEVSRWPMEHTATAERPARDIELLLTVGGRYYGLAVDVDFDVLPDRSASDWWIDPMIGAAVSVPISQHLSIVGMGEIGGFGVASDFAWTASLALSWDFHIGQFPSSLQAGYLAIGDDYESGSGSSRREWNTILHGLMLNFVMHF